MIFGFDIFRKVVKIRSSKRHKKFKYVENRVYKSFHFKNVNLYKYLIINCL